MPSIFFGRRNERHAQPFMRCDVIIEEASPSGHLRYRRLLRLGCRTWGRHVDAAVVNLKPSRLTACRSAGGVSRHRLAANVDKETMTPSMSIFRPDVNLAEAMRSRIFSPIAVFRKV